MSAEAGAVILNLENTVQCPITPVAVVISHRLHVVIFNVVSLDVLEFPCSA